MSLVCGSKTDAEIEKLKEKYPSLYEIWSGRHSTCEADLRDIADARWVNFQELLGRAILNNVAWLENQHIPLNVAALSSGVMKTADDVICGYDFLVDKPSEIPCMTSNAAFPMRYAHVLPALMIANFMKSTQSENVDMTVLCQGYGFTLEEKWWQEGGNATADDAARFITESDAFKKYLAHEAVKPIKRICIWIVCTGHVFMVVWEQGAFHDVMYFIDNAVGVDSVDPFRTEFLAKFKERMSPHRPQGSRVKMCEYFKKSMFSSSRVEIQPDLVCVSFMARSTAYLNSMDSFFDHDALEFIVHLADVRFQALCYLEFEKALAEFLVASLTRGACGSDNLCVWLPKAMEHKFLNINEICLLVLNPSKDNAESATRFEFFFGQVSAFHAVYTGEVPIDIDRLGHRSKAHTACCVMSECQTAQLMGGCRKALNDALGLLGK